jgi:hypothetical protein
LTLGYCIFKEKFAHFVVLNSNEDSEEYANFSKDQVEWLKADVKAAKAAVSEWIIVNIHKGPYTTSNHATDKDIKGTNGVRSKIAPIMAELGIDFVVQGHDHIYARTKPIKANGTAAATEKITESLNGKTVEYTVNPDGSIYLIPATAGAKVYYKNQKPELGVAYYNLFEVADENHAAPYGPDPSDNKRPKRGQIQNFVGITVDGGKLTAVSYEIDQNKNDAQPYIIEQFGIIKKTGSDNGGGNTGGGNNGGNSGNGNTGGTGNTGSTGGNNTTGTGVGNTNTGENSQNNGNNGNSGNSGNTSNAGGTPAKVAFTDTASHWAAAAIQKAVQAGFVNGYADHTFRPNQEVNRAEFITMLARALQFPDSGNSPSFKDLNKIPVWAQSFVAQAVSLGIVSGYDDGTFRPTKKLTRTELAVMVVRSLGITVDTKATLSFTDAKDIPAWAVPYIAAAADAGLVNGIGQNRFAPNQVATRAEAVTLILNVLENKGK